MATILAVLLLTQSPVAAVDRVDVAYDDLAADRNATAAARIEANADLDQGDPARLINLGVAYARQGKTEHARALFTAAATTLQRVELETATGEWIDSRDLARRALSALDRGEFTETRTAMR